VIAETRVRDVDGRLRHVLVTARTAAQARQILRERLLERPTFGSTRVLTPQSTFADLAEVWLAGLAIQRLAEGTKQTYRDHVRLHVLAGAAVAERAEPALRIRVAARRRVA
jgi:hypothetical protein